MGMELPLLKYDSHFVTGKNILITGSTSGIGEALVYLVAGLNPNKIFLACRSLAKGEAVKQKLTDKGVASEILVGDMGHIDGVKQIANAMLATKEPLHVLVSNAGLWEAQRNEKVMSLQPRLEQHFMTNYLSMVILCKDLKPLLERNAPSRIVITGSFTHIDIVKGKANVDDLQFEDGKVTRQVPNDLAYAQSKLLQYMWAKKFATMVEKDVAVMVYDPGQCETNNDVYKVMKSMTKCCFKCVLGMMGTRTPKDGAEIALWCADSPDAASCNGKYVDFGIYRKLKPNPPCDLGYSPTHKQSAESIQDQTQVDRLWNETEKLLA